MIFRKLNAEQEEKIAILRSTAIFCDLSSDECIELLHMLHERTFAAGETIFTEGEPGLALYVIVKGEIEVKRVVAGNKNEVGRLGPSDVFGEVSFLDGGSRSATATAITKTDLLGFYRMELLDLLDCKPVLASRILFALARQMSMRTRATLQLIQ